MGSTLKLCLILILVAGLIFFVLDHYRLEEQWFGFSYTHWAMNQCSDVLISIHQMLDAMLKSVRNSGAK